MRQPKRRVTAAGTCWICEIAAAVAGGGGGGTTVVRILSRLSRKQLAEHSRQLLALVLERGSGQDAIAAIRAGANPEDPSLF